LKVPITKTNGVFNIYQIEPKIEYKGGF